MIPFSRNCLECGVGLLVGQQCGEQDRQALLDRLDKELKKYG